jgi:hypothetical protein
MEKQNESTVLLPSPLELFSTTPAFLNSSGQKLRLLQRTFGIGYPAALSTIVYRLSSGFDAILDKKKSVPCGPLDVWLATSHQSHSADSSAKMRCIRPKPSSSAMSKAPQQFTRSGIWNDDVLEQAIAYDFMSSNFRLQLFSTNLQSPFLRLHINI